MLSKNRRIYWQVGENKEHDIPPGACMVVHSGDNSVEAWIDDNGDIVIQEIIRKEGSTFTDVKVLGDDE